MIARSEALQILQSMTQSASLLRHARTVELVMEALAKKYDENVQQFSIAGLLHDADYEKYPDQHPKVIVQQLEEMGEAEIAYAIAGHYSKWGVPRNSLLDKCLLAADELTGFIYACALIRPTKIEGLTAKSVMKKLKNKKFAASVDREEVYLGAELLDMDIRDLITFIIKVLEENRVEIEL